MATLRLKLASRKQIVLNGIDEVYEYLLCTKGKALRFVDVDFIPDKPIVQEELVIADVPKLKIPVKSRYNILIVDKQRERSPLLTDFQKGLVNHHDPNFRFIYTDQIDAKIDDVVPIKSYPDIIYTGFMAGDFIKNNRENIRRNNIALIAESADNYLIKVQNVVDRLGGVVPIALVIRTYDNIDIVKDALDNDNRLKGASVLFVPWAVDMNKYVPKSYPERDIDVAYISTVSKNYDIHVNKVKALKVVSGLSCNVFTDAVWGRKYIDILLRTKIFVVAGRVYDTMVQRYLEGAAAGCLMIGEMPKGAEGFLEEGKTFVSTPKGEYDNIPEIVRYYLDNPTERDKIGAAVRDRCEKMFSLDKVIADFLDKLRLLVYEGRTK